MVKNGFAILILGVLGFAAFSFYSFVSKAPDSSGQAREVFYELPSGTTAKKIAHDLEGLGVVKNSFLFFWYARLTGKVELFKSADYRLTTGLTPGQVISILTSGISYGVPMTIPEGYNMKQIAGLLDALQPGLGDRFLAICKDAEFINELGLGKEVKSLEGYLFPDTYLVTRKANEREIARAMVKKFLAMYTPEFEQRAREIQMTRHQIVTLASIVEKETGASHERPKIASVFFNRLKKKMRLQSDPTVIYGIENYNGNITRADLGRYSPYNTYQIPALPIGPIANPGDEAIRAVLFPEHTDYLFFVSHNDGTHEFTTTYAAHAEAVKRYQLDAKAREGRSWRELSNRPKAQ